MMRVPQTIEMPDARKMQRMQVRLRRRSRRWRDEKTLDRIASLAVDAVRSAKIAMDADLERAVAIVEAPIRVRLVMVTCRTTARQAEAMPSGAKVA